MSINVRLSSLGLLFAFVISGCQSPYNKSALASKDRTSPKSKSQGNSEDRAAWPPKSIKGGDRMAKLPDAKSEAFEKNSDQTKEALQLADLLEKGDRFRKSGQYEDARLVYNGALTISPDNADVHHRLAIIADKQQQFSVADQNYQAALRSRPKDVNLLSDLGYSYSLRGHAKQAEQTLKQALAIDPTHRGAMANLGTIYAQQDRYTEALVMARKGSSSESEARQYMAKLFPESTADVLTASDKESTRANPLMASTPPEAVPDISQFSHEQLQLELARREQGRSREKSWDEAEPDMAKSEHRQSQPQRTTSLNSDRDPADGTSRIEMSRSQADPQILQTRAQSNGATPNVVRQTDGVNQANRLAARIGMNSGPGNLFPILLVNNNSNSFMEVAPVSEGTTSLQQSGSRNRFAESANFTRSDAAASSTAELAKPAAELAKPAAERMKSTQNGFANSAKATITSATANWRDGLQNSISWDSDTQNADASSSGFDATGKSSWGSGQGTSVKKEKGGTSRSETNSVAGVRNGTDGSRPYNGAWPKSNDIPAKPNQNPLTNSQSPDNFDGPTSGDVIGSPRFANGASTSLPSRTLTQWPDAPNR